MTNRMTNIPMTINMCEQKSRMSSEKMFLRSFVSATILLNRSPDLARLWNDSESRCRCENSSRRNE